MIYSQPCNLAGTGSACHPIDQVLSRLDKVKANGASKWKACCPAHDDRDPSLSIREADDGKVLLHCWCGCSARDVAAAIGLELRDLFPGKYQQRRGPSKAAIEHERRIVSIGLSLLAQGAKLPQTDLDRLDIARRRLARLEACQ
ncbi:DNA primase [Pseudomonas sp. SCT]|jgi:hypothetical protein|uniref:virulence-associated protein E n=1 Tax=Pseudomonas sp. (strain SCT) TaxID=412955 RepID=UPI000EED2CEC|nr:virulence-associated protein E [Pseudomonas sp. SCT]GCA56414.1 DNA primase [Pseudomonas sp. SCT]